MRYEMRMKTRIALLAVLLAAGACKKDEKKAPATATETAAKPAEPTPTTPAPAEPAAAPVEKALDDTAPLDVGKGVTLTFAKKETDPGGDNAPPTMKHTVTAKCGGKDVVVLDSEHEGGEAKVRVGSTADKATVIMDTHIAREGEIDDLTETATLDLATCTVTKS